MTRPIRIHTVRITAWLASALAALCFLVPAFTAPGRSPVSILDARGVRIELPEPPAGIVSLSPSLTETLFAVGAGDAVEGVTTYCNYPDEASEREKVGGFSARTLSIETILSLEPDLVFADLTRHASVIETLEGYGVAVFAVNPVSIDDCLETVRLVAEAAGRAEEGRALASRMRERIDAVTAVTGSIPASERPVVYWEVFDEPLMSTGPETFIGQLIDLAGGRNAFSDAGESWPRISREALLQRNPDVFMSSESHGEKFNADAVRARVGWSEIAAVRTGRIHLFDGDIVSRPGPRIVEALEMMAAALYPDRFRP